MAIQLAENRKRQLHTFCVCTCEDDGAHTRVRVPVHGCSTRFHTIKWHMMSMRALDHDGCMCVEWSNGPPFKKADFL